MTQFLCNARRSGMCTDMRRVHASSISRARAKVSWRQFEQTSKDFVAAALEQIPWDENDTWHGMQVVAIDGSKHTLPATEEIRATFDAARGRDKRCGHYPECMVMTVYDVFRRIPLVQTVAGCDASERHEAQALREHLPRGAVALFDRGFPSYDVIADYLKHYDGYFVFRCPATKTFPAVMNALRCGLTDADVFLQPSVRAQINHPNKNLVALRVRMIRLKNDDGTMSVLLTNLYDRQLFRTADLRQLYQRRWKIEEYYREQKCLLHVEQFHSRTANGILQELYAAMIISVVSRTLVRLCQLNTQIHSSVPQFKNAVVSFASEAHVLTTTCVRAMGKVLNQLLLAINEVRYAAPKHRRPPQPRISKKPPNKWTIKRGKLVRKFKTRLDCLKCQS